ncbi:MAG: 2-aminoethylphosphonate-pyruvate transaminase [Pirellulaceae bacterium]|jgi:2-aminoethylphosphonate-pyruvate transaminase
MDDDIPYLLLTPGPLTTSKSVKQVMMQDFCTWDDDYNNIVSDIRERLVALAQPDDSANKFTSVLMQGSGTFSVEATLGSVIPTDGKVLIATNGAYGKRIAQIADRLKIERILLVHSEIEAIAASRVEQSLADDPSITHVAMVHCETTTGLLNPAEEIGEIVKKHGKTYIVDAMSSFGGIEMTMNQLGADYLISSANKCIQGVPGFGFVVANRENLEKTAGSARSLSLDLYDQWTEMETKGGKWRYTSPTHTVRAFSQALAELEQEGGVAARAQRYKENQRLLADGMEQIGFQLLLPRELHSPIITSFVWPDDPDFTFERLYAAMKSRRFVIYPGKVSKADTFRIGNIGHVFPEDIEQLIAAVRETVIELDIKL